MALYQQLPFFNPSVPFTRLIQGGLKDGMSITVCGRVLSDANRFQMDLKYGSDIALHFNPRYDGGSGYVMHNTYQNGRWGSEERKYETPFPKGQLLALQILVTLGSYKISTNGKPFSEYKHRMPFSWVDRIHMSGKVELSLVAFQYLAVTIFCSRHYYEVFVSGEQTHNYSRRVTKLEEIDVLEVSGDVQLTFVQP